MPIEYRRKTGFIAGIPSDWPADGRHKPEKLRGYLIRGSSKGSDLCENTFSHRRERSRGPPHTFSSERHVLRDVGSIAGKTDGPHPRPATSRSSDKPWCSLNAS